MQTSPTWLASYPRSGNTYLRTILFQCFGLRSGSVYPNDLGDSPELRQATGHIEHGKRGVNFAGQSVKLVKTHWQKAPVQGATIYVVRNGIDAVRSLHQFYDYKMPLDQIIRGWQFGTWAQHVTAWSPGTRPNTLLLRYEDIDRDMGAAVDAVAAFLGVEPVARSLPPRAKLADGQWVNVRAERAPLTPDELSLFRDLNGQVMAEYGYDC